MPRIKPATAAKITLRNSTMITPPLVPVIPLSGDYIQALG